MLSTTTRRQISLSSTLRLLLINPNTTTICNDRARVSSYSMGNAKMQLLSTWTTIIPNMDRPQASRRNFSQISPRARQSTIMRMREKILPYSFSVTWVPGKTHYIADALSRYPVFQPDADHIPTEDAIVCLNTTAVNTMHNRCNYEGLFANNCIPPIEQQSNSHWASGYTVHCLLYTSPSPRDLSTSRMPSSA